MITEAGTDPKVERLVYIAAFAPDAGESVQSLIANPPAGAPVPPILPPQEASCSSTGRSSPPLSLPMSMPPQRPSWRIRRCPGAWRRWPARSASRPGDQAELVSGRHRGPHDPPPAQRHGQRAGATVPRPPAAMRSTSRTRPRSPRSSSVPPRRPRRSTSRKRKHPGPVGPRLARQLLANSVEKVRRTRASKRMETRFFSIVGSFEHISKYKTPQNRSPLPDRSAAYAQLFQRNRRRTDEGVMTASGRGRVKTYCRGLSP